MKLSSLSNFRKKSKSPSQIMTISSQKSILPTPEKKKKAHTTKINKTCQNHSFCNMEYEVDEGNDFKLTEDVKISFLKLC